MSPSNRELRIQSDDPTAEIKVLNVSANIVARGVGSLAKLLPEGLYKVRVRVGPEFQERIVTLDASVQLQKFPRLDIPSPIPIDNTARSHEYHQVAVGQAWDSPAKALGSGSRLLIAAREWSADNGRSHPDPAGALSVILPSGDEVKFTTIAKVRQQGDAFAIGVVDVDPGFYRVELELPDGSRLRRALHASPGWTTQLYMLFRDAAGQRLPDLAGGSVAIAYQPVVHDENARLAEIALDALIQHREILSGHMRMLLSDKFEQPLLGLIGAHLLLRDGLPGGAFNTVVNNLTYMLGADHPDVVALRTKISGAAPAPVTEPPMLRASWDLLVEASSRIPGLIAPESPAAKVGELVVSSGSWLVWQPLAAEDDTSRVDAKLDVLRAYVQAQAQTRAPAGIDKVVLESANPGGPGDELGEESRADLSRALGMPRATLDSMLKRL